MNVVLLSSARRTTPDAALSIREQLGLAGRDDVVIRLVALHRPGRPLPGMETLVLDPKVLARGRVLTVPAAPLPAEGRTGPATEDLSATPAEAAVATADAPVAPAAPRTGVAKVVHGVRWRARRAKRQVAAHPQVKRVASSTKVRKVRSAVKPLGPASGFAVAALAAREVQPLVRDADVVVALDANTYRAAWLLARRHPGPDVVVGAAAGKQAAERRRG